MMPREITLKTYLMYSKSELDKTVSLSICGLAPAQSKMDLFLDTLDARNKERAATLTNQEKPCHV